MTRGYRTRLVAFAVVFAVWTWKLLEPHPIPDAVRTGATATAVLLMSKGLHFVGYAALAALGVSLTRRWGWVVALLALHGVATEVAQTFVPNRTGRVIDVLIDWAGIAAGVGVDRLIRRR